MFDVIACDSLFYILCKWSLPWEHILVIRLDKYETAAVDDLQLRSFLDRTGQRSASKLKSHTKSAVKSLTVKMCIIKVLLLSFCAGITLANHVEDPLCVLKGCPRDTPCRVVAECSSPGKCSIRAECIANPPKFSHTGVCQVGQPLLIMHNGSWDDTHCYPANPCPNSFYCNIELQDTYATCCRSDPSNAIKPGQCTTERNNDTFFCVDTCKRDGDCRYRSKCCETGCRRECLLPQPVNSCQNTVCPTGTYCLTPAMDQCKDTGVCYNVGDCVPCAPLCRKRCVNGFKKDSLGCPICKCKPRYVKKLVF